MIGQDVADALPELRAQAESMMTDTCTIDRLAMAWSEVAQKTVPTWTPVLVGVPCAFVAQPAATRSLLTDEAVTLAGPQVKVSVTVEGVEPDDRVTLASGPVVYVTDVPTRTHQVQRRLECRWVK